MSPLQGSPTWSLGKDAHHQSFLLRNLQGPEKRSPLSRFPSQSAHRERYPISRAPFQLCLRVLGEQLPHDTQQGHCGERCLSPEPLQGPVNKPPTKFPNGGPMESDVHPLDPPLHVLLDPRKGTPLNRAPTKQDAPFPEPSNYFLKFQSTDSPGSPTCPYGERHPSPELSSTPFPQSPQ